MRNQGQGGLYRGGENKKVKATKAEKVYDALAKDRRKNEKDAAASKASD